MGRKYIIEIIGGEEGDMDFSTIEPYTEPDMEQVRKEAYQQGLSDAWEAARKICTNWVLPDSVLSEIFGMDKTIDDIMKESTASEAIEKIRQYEQKQEERITKGDVVRIKSAPEVEILVTHADGGHVSGIALTELGDSCEIGDQYTDIIIHKVEKTGEHYEIAEVLRKMKETDNG